MGLEEILIDIPNPMLSLLALGSLVLLAAPDPSSSPRPLEPDSVDVARVETYDGTLAISRLTDVNGRREFHVRVGDVLLFRDSTAQNVLLHTITTWSGRRVAVLEISSGGNACPSAFRIVAFSEERRPRASEEFGNCSDIPVVLLDGTRLRVRFPGFYLNHQARRPGFRPPPAETWEYTGDGRVRRLPASASAR